MLTTSWTELRHHPGQHELWRSPKRFVAVAAGRGSGKTDIARRRVVRFLPVRKPWDDPIYFYGLPTYKQAKRVAWVKIRKLVPPEWVRKANDSEMMIETVFGSKLYVVGLDKPQRIEGDQWDGGVLDESSDQKPGVFDLSVLPALSHRNGWCWRIGVPKRYGVGASEFKAYWELGRSGADPDIESYWWPSRDILTQDQLRFAQHNLAAKDYSEQYEASWESAGGGVFYSFSCATNVDARAAYRPDLPIIVGSDFNVDPMAWTFSHRIPGLDEYHTFAELWLRDTNTPAAIEWTRQRWGSHRSGWLFVGDASGRARKTSASRSDYLLIKSATGFRDAKIWYRRANPPVRDRFAACNALLRDASGRSRAVISPDCTHLVADLEARTYKEGSNEPADAGDLGHISDAWGYPVERLFPVRAAAEGEARVIAA